MYQQHLMLLIHKTISNFKTPGMDVLSAKAKIPKIKKFWKPSPLHEFYDFQPLAQPCEIAWIAFMR